MRDNSQIMTRWILTLVLFAPLHGQDRAQDHAALIETVRQRATQYTRDLPNFVCRQENVRERDPSGTRTQWKTVDTVVEQLTYFDHKEKYEVVSINGKPAPGKTHDQLGNLKTSGEFGSSLNVLFKPKARAEFEWARQDAIGGRPVQVIAFRVAQQFSDQQLTLGKRKVNPGYHGWLYVDGESGAVLKLVSISEMPAGFPIQAITHELDYSSAEIAGQTYLLPAKSQLEIQLAGGFQRNVITFSGYRKFDAATNIKFDPQ